MMSAKKLLAIIFSKVYEIYSCFEHGKAINSELYAIIRSFEEIAEEQLHMYEEGKVLFHQDYTLFVVILVKIRKLLYISNCFCTYHILRI